MFILTLVQDDCEMDLAVFNSLEDGRQFLSKIDGYHYNQDEEFISPDQLPLYTEISHNGHQFPLTTFMFPGSETIQIFWKELPNLSQPGQGLVEASTRVDAYQINNEDLKDYIYKREEKYEAIKSALESQGYEVIRDFQGSEDGEAILYRQSPEDRWRFYHHLDPSILDLEI